MLNLFYASLRGWPGGFVPDNADLERALAVIEEQVLGYAR